MHSSIEVNPFRARLWHLHDRLEEHISEESCKAEIASFSKHGQLVPVLGRRLQRDPDFDVELIYGARRLFVARHLNVPLLVDLRDLNDREAVVAMDVENRHRKDVSPYERGLAYTRWLRTGFFRSQEEIARSLGVSPSQVSRLVKLARLPAAIVAAFASGVEICEEWGLTLVDCIEDQSKRQAVMRRAREISHSPRLPAAEVYRQLLSASQAGRKPRILPRDQIVHDGAGQPLFRIRQRRDSYALLLPTDRISGKKLREIQDAVASILTTPSKRTLEPESVSLCSPLARSGLPCPDNLVPTRPPAS